MKIYTKICKCGRKMKPEFKQCWRCHTKEANLQACHRGFEREMAERKASIARRYPAL